jgi:hypothetical protein
MKKILSLAVVILALGLTMSAPVAAQSPSPTPSGNSTRPVINSQEVSPTVPGGAKGMEDAGTAYKQNLDSYDKPEASLGKSTSSSLNANFVALTCMMISCNNQDGQRIDQDNTTSALDQTFGVMTKLYTPQVSTYTYVADVLNHMGVSTPTYAQGYGYYSLQTMLGLWKVFRNIAYVFFTVIIIFIGFVIMFRQKIGGQAVITVQQALPRVIIALLMVTFSYAIAGLAVDLMYLVMFLFLQFLNVTGEERDNLVNGGFGWLFSRILGGATAQSWSVTTEAVGAIFEDFGGWFNPLSWIAEGVGGILFMLVVVIAAFFSAFRLLFALLTSYISFLLNVMFAPLILMVGAIPGVKTFQKWLMSLVADLSPFVVVMVLLAFQQVLATSLTGVAYYNTGTVNAAGMFVPPYVVSGGVGGSAVASIVSLGILLTLPEFVKKIKAKLGGGSGFFGDIAGAFGTNLRAAVNKTPLPAAKNFAVGAVKSGASRQARGALGAVLGSTGLAKTMSATDVAANKISYRKSPFSSRLRRFAESDEGKLAIRNARSGARAAAVATGAPVGSQQYNKAYQSYLDGQVRAASRQQSVTAYKGTSVKQQFTDWSSRQPIGQARATGLVELRNMATQTIAKANLAGPGSATEKAAFTWLKTYTPGVLSSAPNFAAAVRQINWQGGDLNNKYVTWIDAKKPSASIYT